MPNWCRNRLTVAGDGPALEEFLRENAGTDTALSFARSLPVPETFPESDTSEASIAAFVDRITGVSNPINAYEWCIANWGTKWDADAPLARRRRGALEYRFGTAWSPPVAWMIAISEKYAELVFTLKYGEPGCDFAGRIIVRNGEVESEYQCDYGELWKD